MTAPTVPADLAAVVAQIQSVRARIAAISGTSTNPTSGAAFASALSSTTATSPATGTGSVTGDAVVADASKYLGVPYVWGGESTSGMDCSGLVQKTFADLGVHLPRTAAEQQQVGTPVDSLADARPGDLLFFGSPAYHVAIYAGNNKLIESPEPGKTVHVTDVYQQPTSIRRIVGSSAVSGGSGISSDTGISAAVQAYAPQFAAAEQRFGLPSGMLAAVCQQESGGNPRAVSPAGAEGLMQLMPATAAGAGVDPFNASQAITAAARILSRNLDEFGGSVPLALAAYNAGAGAVQQYGGIPPYAETQNYVKRITAMMGIAS